MKTARFIPAFFVCVAFAGAQSAAYTDRFLTVNGLRLHYLDWPAT
jgi:hypothetical protein